MVNSNALGIIFANMHDATIPELIAHRTMASVPFAGRYRMIDFNLSGMANAGIFNIGVVVSKNYRSLMDHLGNGREWDLSRKRGGLAIFPPQESGQDRSREGKISALSHTLDYLKHHNSELVVLSDCGIACNLDYGDLLKAHRASGADITTVYERAAIPEGMLQDNITYELDNHGWVTDIRRNDYKKGSQNLAMFIYVVGRERLINIIQDAMVRGKADFEREVLSDSLCQNKIKGYHFTGYRSRICDMKSFFDQNMRLLKPQNLESLFPEERPIYTKVRDEAAVRYAIGSNTTNSIVADGCIVEGEVENCVLFRGVRIKPGASLKNCVIMQGTVVESGASLENVVTDKNVTVTEGKSLRGTAGFPVFVSKGYRVL